MTIEAHMLADGRRLHLNQGPIDLIIEAVGPGRHDAYDLAVRRFAGLLEELVDELPALRLGAEKGRPFDGPVARRMQRAVCPFLPRFITPMAAVAGAVADEVLAAMIAAPDIDKIYVNNGGDVAFYLGPGQQIEAAIAAGMAGRIVISNGDDCRGVATSGWRGRSHSLGIADSVSVVARDAASADAAATLIANSVDLPGHGAISRIPANDLSPDSDLGRRPVTQHVGRLSPDEISQALDRGEKYAAALLGQKLIAGAMLMLRNQVRQVGPPMLIAQHTGERAYG